MSTVTFSEWSRRFARMVGGLVSLMGIVVLLGWALDVTTLESVLPGWTKMAPITALAFVAAGVWLWCVTAKAPSISVILLTGWGQRLSAEGGVPPHVDRILSKPPRLGELRKALAHCQHMVS
jgi:hypothetical protein